jgi:ADP-heptose:LPS heptosyltransferase
LRAHRTRGCASAGEYFMNATVFRIVTWGGIGDCILMTPLFRQLKIDHPAGNLIVYCQSASHEEVLRNNPHIASLRRFRTPVKYLNRIIRRFTKKVFLRYPAYGNVKPALTYDRQASSIIADIFDVKLASESPEIFLTAGEEAAGSSRVAGSAGPLVAIATTAAFSANKNWYDDRWEALVGRHPGYTFVQLGAPGEKPIKGTRDLLGLPLRASFAVLRHCTALVGPDTAITHAAAALGVPTVALFGPTSPKTWGHRGQCQMYTRMPCSPCIEILASDPCPFGRPCMDAFSTEDVSQNLLEVINHIRPEAHRR